MSHSAGKGRTSVPACWSHRPGCRRTSASHGPGERLPAKEGLWKQRGLSPGSLQTQRYSVYPHVAVGKGTRVEWCKFAWLILGELVVMPPPPSSSSFSFAFPAPGDPGSPSLVGLSCFAGSDLGI